MVEYGVSQDSFLLQRRPEDDYVRRYAYMKSIVKDFVSDYAGRGLILKCASGMGKHYLFHRYAKEAGLERIFELAYDLVPQISIWPERVVYSLPGDIAEDDLFAALSALPEALIIFESSPPRARMRILGEILRSQKSMLSRFEGGFAILASSDYTVTAFDDVFTRFEFAPPPFSAVLAIAENESDEIDDWLRQVGSTDAGDVRDWVRIVREVVLDYTGLLGLSDADIQTHLYFNLRRFVQLIALCPFPGNDDTLDVSRARWIARELRLDALTDFDTDKEGADAGIKSKSDPKNSIRS